MANFTKKRYSRLALLLVFVLAIFKLNGCLQFRESQKKLHKNFEKKGLDIQFKTFRVKGRSLHFLRTNFSDSTKPLAIFVHGSPGSADNFMDNLTDTSLRAHYEMISVDRPGFGYSDFGKSMPSLKGQADLVASVLDSFPKRKIVLIGHSYGGPLIVQLAVDYPDRVQGLLIVAGSVDPELEPHEWWRKHANTTVGRWFIPKVMEVSNQEIMTLKADLYKMVPHWTKVTQPVYVLQGEKDNLVPPGNADFAQKHLVNSSWVKIDKVEGMNHFFPFTRHESINDALIELKSHLD